MGRDIKLLSVQRVERKPKDVCFAKVKGELLFFSKRSKVEDLVKKTEEKSGSIAFAQEMQLKFKQCSPGYFRLKLKYVYECSPCFVIQRSYGNFSCSSSFLGFFPIVLSVLCVGGRRRGPICPGSSIITPYY